MAGPGGNPGAGPGTLTPADPMPRATTPRDVPVAVVGLGLMGVSIAACLLASGHRVVGFDHDSNRRDEAAARIGAALDELAAEGLLPDPAARRADFVPVATLDGLAPAAIAFEAIEEA